MNNQKDIQETSFNSYGHQTSSDIKSLAHRPSLSMSNTKYEFANKKTEKLVTALYMVTDCMETDDSLKSKLRQLGVELLSDMYKLSILSPMDKHAHISTSIARVYEILSFIEISHTIGFVSEMNTMILKKEFSKLISELESHLSQDKHFTFTLDEKMFDQELTEANHSDIGETSTMYLSKEMTDKKTSSNTNSFTDKKIKGMNLEHKTHLSHRDNILEKQERVSKILSLIKDKREVSIKDISTVFSCSEKTVQREVNDLIYKGQIKKTGTKRWSRYSLIS